MCVPVCMCVCVQCGSKRKDRKNGEKLSRAVGRAMEEAALSFSSTCCVCECVCVREGGRGSKGAAAACLLLIARVSSNENRAAAAAQQQRKFRGI